MGKFVSSRETLRAAVDSASKAAGSGPKTKAAEQKAKATGKLHPLVDPAGFGVIRRSLPRLEKKDNGLWELLVGPPLPFEQRLDTTLSMGNNVEIAFEALPTLYDACKSVLQPYDLQISIGVFNDVSELATLCRPQFEMHADKIVEQLGLLVPERDGGDVPEDPQYGLYAAAFLTDAHIVKLGLKGYDMTVTDAPGRDRLDERHLLRIFGNDVFDKVAENGHAVSKKDLPSTAEVVQELLKRSHAFLIQVGHKSDAKAFWSGIFPKDRIVTIPDTSVLTQVQAAIIGLTEGSLDLGNCTQFLRDHQVATSYIPGLLRSLAAIPIGAQAALPNFKKLPKQGDLFETKTSLWPIDPSKAKKPKKKDKKAEGPADDTDWA